MLMSKPDLRHTKVSAKAQVEDMTKFKLDLTHTKVEAQVEDNPKFKSRSYAKVQTKLRYKLSVILKLAQELEIVHLLIYYAMYVRLTILFYSF